MADKNLLDLKEKEDEKISLEKEKKKKKKEEKIKKLYLLIELYNYIHKSSIYIQKEDYNQSKI